MLEGELLFVVGDGGGGTCGSACRKTEIVSLTNEPIPECLNSLSDHPTDMRDHVGGVLPDAGTEIVLFCR